MRILLTIPTDVSSSHKESVIPLGIAYINGALRENGFDVISCNLNYVNTSQNPHLYQLQEEPYPILLLGLS